MGLQIALQLFLCLQFREIGGPDFYQPAPEPAASEETQIVAVMAATGVLL
jgi:hypothetical protein